MSLQPSSFTIMLPQSFATPGEEPHLSFPLHSLPINEYVHDRQVEGLPPRPTLSPAFPPSCHKSLSLNSHYSTYDTSVGPPRLMHTPVSARPCQRLFGGILHPGSDVIRTVCCAKNSHYARIPFSPILPKHCGCASLQRSRKGMARC